MNNIQLKIDKMINILEEEGYRASMNIYHNGKYGTLYIDYKNKQYNRFFYIAIYKTSNNICDFRVQIDINEDQLTLKECENIMDYWKKIVNLCRTLNKLNIPYLSNYECEDLVYREYFEVGYRKIGKRFVVKHLKV